jgi:uncharacterized lipoprotein YbaY
MKKLNLLTVIALTSVILIGACKKKDEPAPVNPTPPIVIPVQTTIQATVSLSGAASFALVQR